MTDIDSIKIGNPCFIYFERHGGKGDDQDWYKIEPHAITYVTTRNRDVFEIVKLSKRDRRTLSYRATTRDHCPDRDKLARRLRHGCQRTPPAKSVFRKHGRQNVEENILTNSQWYEQRMNNFSTRFPAQGLIIFRRKREIITFFLCRVMNEKKYSDILILISF